MFFNTRNTHTRYILYRELYKQNKNNRKWSEFF